MRAFRNWFIFSKTCYKGSYDSFNMGFQALNSLKTSKISYLLGLVAKTAADK
jgi:hypothetical protein